MECVDVHLIKTADNLIFLYNYIIKKFENTLIWQIKLAFSLNIILLAK